MRNITAIRVKRQATLPAQQTGTVYGFSTVGYDLPAGVHTISSGSLSQDLPVSPQALVGTLFRLLTASIQQDLPLPNQTIGVEHERILLASIGHTLPIPTYTMEGSVRLLRRAVLKQFLPLPLQEVSSHLTATLLQDLPVVSQTLGAGFFLVATLTQDLPVGDQALTGEELP